METNQREAFEAWVQKEAPYISLVEIGGLFHYQETRTAWKAWQAALASVPSTLTDKQEGEWSTTPPTIRGWYWSREPESMDSVAVFVDGKGHAWCGAEILEPDNMERQGLVWHSIPITPPKSGEGEQP